MQHLVTRACCRDKWGVTWLMANTNGNVPMVVQELLQRCIISTRWSLKRFDMESTVTVTLVYPGPPKGAKRVPDLWITAALPPCVRSHS